MMKGIQSHAYKGNDPKKELRTGDIIETAKG